MACLILEGGDPPAEDLASLVRQQLEQNREQREEIRALRAEVEELKRLQRELGISFIHVTHSQEEAMALADVIVVMNDGNIEQFGAPRDA